MTKVAENIFTIDNFLSTEECNNYIKLSEEKGYEQAKVNTEKGSRVIESVRNNNRVLFTDYNLAANLWDRLSPYAPQKIGNSIAIGLNELFRFYKYEPGQQFRKHNDQSFIRKDIEASYYTFLIYLNDDFEGGETTFNHIHIKPKTGTALIFLHSLEHAGTEVTHGTKYVLRTDIMYRLKEEY